MDDQQMAFERVLRLLDSAGCLEHVILIGSWVEFVYRESGLLKGFNPIIRTLDIDILVRNLRRPNPPANLVTVARDAGYLVQSDRLDGSTRLLDMSGLEVEFLICKVGAGVEETLKTHIGVTAQAMRHLDILSSHTVRVICLGYSLIVPTPEAYSVHKMVINSKRGLKAEKDAATVLGLYPSLDSDKFSMVLGSLIKKERSAALSFLQRYGLTLPGNSNRLGE